jgi:hypothetical protein
VSGLTGSLGLIVRIAQRYKFPLPLAFVVVFGRHEDCWSNGSGTFDDRFGSNSNVELDGWFVFRPSTRQRGPARDASKDIGLRVEEVFRLFLQSRELLCFVMSIPSVVV